MACVIVMEGSCLKHFGSRKDAFATQGTGEVSPLRAACVSVLDLGGM